MLFSSLLEKQCPMWSFRSKNPDPIVNEGPDLIALCSIFFSELFPQSTSETLRGNSPADCELTAVNNGSSDGTRRVVDTVIRQFAPLPIRYVAARKFLAELLWDFSWLLPGAKLGGLKLHSESLRVGSCPFLNQGNLMSSSGSH